MEFMLGCNYWASHAGTNMWIDWNEDAVKTEFQLLSAHGVRYLRVFPVWRDFQPVEPYYNGRGALYEYGMPENRPTLCHNPWYIDETMIGRFRRLCDHAQACGIHLIVGLITGWMSGRLFVPPALYGKNVITDATALMMEQKFVRGFIEMTRDCPAIYAWDLGNECNCMANIQDRAEAYTWAAAITNAIRAADHTRPVVSGMHALRLDNQWRIADQAEICDILTTHPYLYWVKHCSFDPVGSVRSMLHATAETRLYASIGGKKCLVEEIGSMGPTVCSDDMAANFLRVNLFSNWAHGALGVMWWCANDQDNLNSRPYTWKMVERELGMMDAQLQPKPVLKEMKIFSDFLDQLDFTPPEAETDACCILTHNQDHWGVAYMSYILAKQAGINLSFVDQWQKLPESRLYFLPAITGCLVMDKARYEDLKRRVREGASLYISCDNGILSGFEALTGLHVLDQETLNRADSFRLDGQELPCACGKHLITEPRGAEVLASLEGNPMFSVCTYGKGRVYFLNMPLETNLLESPRAFDGHISDIYRRVARDCLPGRAASTDNRFLGLTIHPGEVSTYVVLVNYSEHPQKPNLHLAPGYSLDRVIYGSSQEVPAFDAAVLRLKRG